MKKVHLSAFICSLIVVTIAHTASAAGQGRHPSASEWRADLHTLATQMPLKHKSLFHTMTREEFDRAVNTLDADIPGLDSAQIVVRLAQLCAMVQDGHSGLSLLDQGNDAKSRVPVRFMQCADGIFVRAAAPQYADVVGGRLVAVGTAAVDDAMRRVYSIVSHDPGNDGEQRAWGAKLYLNETGLLYGLGLSATDSTATYVIEKAGARRTVVMKRSEPLGTWYLNTLPPGWIEARPASRPVPLAYQHEGEHYWFTYLEDRQTVYFQFNIVLNGGNETLADFASRLGTFIEEHPVERLVIDLRNNTGGDNTLLRPLLVTLFRSKVNHRGGLYVITGSTTFSAAQNFVNRLENYAEVIFVGEPTAQNVNFYGDPAIIPLPHSGLSAAVSRLWWQDKDPRDSRTCTSPEIAATMTFQDYVDGRDPAEETAVTTPTPLKIEQWLEQGLAGGMDTLLARYQAFIADPAHRYLPDPERELNSYGYRLLGAKRVADAVLVFRVIARFHPASSNAFDSLGEGLAAAGDYDHALEAYRRSLELNPNNTNAKSVIERLAKSKR
ncbi:MAG TPA: tetratricopeptide repeat protein [Bacteroidota bacterium]